MGRGTTRSVVEGWRRIACDPTTATRTCARSTPPSRREDAPRHLPIGFADREETMALIRNYSRIGGKTSGPFSILRIQDPHLRNTLRPALIIPPIPSVGRASDPRSSMAAGCGRAMKPGGRVPRGSLRTLMDGVRLPRRGLGERADPPSWRDVRPASGPAMVRADDPVRPAGRPPAGGLVENAPRGAACFVETVNPQAPGEARPLRTLPNRFSRSGDEPWVIGDW
jgi:hypothetical protein